VGGVLAHGDGTLRKSPQAFGMPAEMVLELHLCMDHFCRNLCSAVRNVKGQTALKAQIGVGMYKQMHHLSRLIYTACWQVFSNLKASADELTEQICTEIRERILRNSIVHACGVHDSCGCCGPNLAKLCPEAANGDWCDAHATEKQTGSKYAGCCPDMPPQLFDKDGTCHDVVMQLFDALAPKFMDDKIRRFSQARQSTPMSVAMGSFRQWVLTRVWARFTLVGLLQPEQHPQ
jgi:hypothetical protein